MLALRWCLPCSGVCSVMLSALLKLTTGYCTLGDEYVFEVSNAGPGGLGASTKASMQNGLEMVRCSPNGSLALALREKYPDAGPLEPQDDPIAITAVNDKPTIDALDFAAVESVKTSSLGTCEFGKAPEGREGVYVTKPSSDGAVPSGVQIVAVNNISLLKLSVDKGVQLLSLVAEAGGEAQLELSFVGIEGFATHEFFVGCGTATLTVNVEKTAQVQSRVASFLQSCRGGVMKIEVLEEIEHRPPKPGMDTLAEPPTPAALRKNLTMEDMSMMV